MTQPYLPRLIDRQLDRFLPQAAALALEGARGVGKTETASRRAKTAYRLDVASDYASVQAQPDRIAADPSPVLLVNGSSYRRFGTLSGVQ